MSVNKVILLGNVGQEPDVKKFETGSVIAQISIATTEKGYTLQNGTQVPERTEWHNVVLRNGLASVVEKYVKKGDKVYIEGKIRTRSYEDKNKVTRYITEIFADSLELLTSKKDGQAVQAPIEPTNGLPW